MKMLAMHHLSTDSDIDPDFEPHMSGEPHLITQSELNDLVCQKQKQNYWDQDCKDGVCCQKIQKFLSSDDLTKLKFYTG